MNLVWFEVIGVDLHLEGPSLALHFPTFQKDLLQTSGNHSLMFPIIRVSQHCESLPRACLPIGKNTNLKKQGKTNFMLPCEINKIRFYRFSSSLFFANVRNLVSCYVVLGLISLS